MSLNQRQKTRVFCFIQKTNPTGLRLRKPMVFRPTVLRLMILPFHFKNNNIIIFKIYFDM